MEKPALVLTTTEARQASPRRLNLHVLVGSMALAVIAAVVLFYGFTSSQMAIEKEQPAASYP